MALYPIMTSQELYEWIKNNLMAHPDNGYSPSNLQTIIFRSGYATPDLEKIEAELENLVSQGFVIRPFGKSGYPSETIYRYTYGGTTPEQNIGTSILKTMTEHTIDDITSDQMNRVIRRLRDMAQSDRNSPVRVGQVIADELGEEKALEYVEKALANGLIKRKDYDPMRAAIILRMPREKIPTPWAGAGSQQLLAGQKKLQEDLGKIRELGLSSLQKPVEKLNKDIQKIKKAWGL